MASAAEPALLARSLTAGYGSTVAIEDVSIEVPYGSTVAVLGPNGCGKSSLFAAAVGVLPARRGQITVGPRGVAWLPQHMNVEPAFPITVRGAVEMGRWGLGADRARGGISRWARRLDRTDHARVEAALEALEITALAGRRLSALSGGQRQRALVAQVMVQDAGLILLDEPLAGVDRPSADAISRVIAGWKAEGRAVMVATHNLEMAAREFDLVLALNRRAVAFGPAATVCTEEVLRETFSGHVALIGEGELVDTAHHHHEAG